MSTWHERDERSRGRPSPILFWLGLAGLLLLLLGMITPWISPRRDFDYAANKLWFTEQLHRLDNVEEVRPLVAALGCSLPCNLDLVVAASPWAMIDTHFASGRNIAGWQLLGHRFQPAGSLRAMVVISLILLAVTVAWLVSGRSSGGVWAILLGVNAFVGLALSVLQLPKVDTLGYDHHFLLSLLATLAGSHQGWGLWFVLSGCLLSLALAGSIAVSTTVTAPIKGEWDV